MISTVPYGSYSIQPRPGSCAASSSWYLRRVHLRTRLAANFASPAVVAMAATNASNGPRSRSSASAAAIAASFSSINFASCSSWRLRHSMSRVRPLANVLRSRATVAGMSTGAALDTPLVESEVFGATDSVVIIVLPEQSCPLQAGEPLIGDNRDPNHPVGRAVGRILTAEVWLRADPSDRGYLTQGMSVALIWLRSVGAGARVPLPVAPPVVTCPDEAPSAPPPGCVM